jgi:endonuclease YncB( thermonuclease family)
VAAAFITRRDKVTGNVTIRLAESARVIDGDTREWKGERIRLQGFDALEIKQSCERDGGTWLCGKPALVRAKRNNGSPPGTQK